jgi:hypothetical protein
MNLLNEVSIREVGAPVALASNTDQNSDRIDMANWEGVLFIVPITDSVATGVATLKVEENTADSDTGMAALSGAQATATSVENDDLNNQLLVVDVYKPRERYVQAVITSGTANIAFGNTLAILYRGRKRPVTDDASVLDSALAISPAE